MQYFFILGINSTLSMAELAPVFPNGRFALVQKNIAILETDYKIRPDIIKKIGGVVKFGLIHDETASLAVQNILKAIIIFSKPQKLETKFKFGISYYGKSKINIKALAMEFKKSLKQSGINSRWVISREPVLSSVVVEQNKLTAEQGAEIIIIEFDKKLFLGKTLAVQPFKELSFRDYGRPSRDHRSGLLPPKLAQIMLNLAVGSPLIKEDEVILQPIILDPFCGSGTIIAEAALMGFKNLIGSDNSKKALKDTKTNVSWIQSNFQLSTFNFQLFHSNATQISKYIAPNSVDAIITEPYLGPPRGRIDIKKVKIELEKLYADSLREFYKILKPNGRIVMIWPVFQMSSRGTPATEPVDRSNLAPADLGKTLNPNLNSFTIINPIPHSLQKNIFLQLTVRHTIIYGRPGQKVWREIVVLEKNKIASACYAYNIASHI